MHALAEGLKGRSHDPENIRRFYPGSLGQYFSRDSGLVYDSGTPDLKGAKHWRIGWPSHSHLGVNQPATAGRNPRPSGALGWKGSEPMPYALFCHEAKLSKAYPTEADVWKLARQSGLVVDRYRKRKSRSPGRCSTMTTRSGPAERIRRKTRQRTRPKPSARTSSNFI